jgi:hypothetical protein
MQKKPTEQQLVREVEQYGKEHYARTGKLWMLYLDDQVGLSDAIKLVVLRQGAAQNCPKPIGLFLGKDELVAMQDETTAVGSDEARRRSFIESFQYFAEYDNYGDPISREVVISAVAKLLSASSLPNPRDEQIKQYVEDRYRRIERKRQSDDAVRQ